MDEVSKLPTRHTRAVEAREKLSEDIPQMTEIVRHNRRNRSVAGEISHPRVVKASMNVQIVQEEDGSESVVVESDVGLLGAKGLLHDALYALVHTP